MCFSQNILEKFEAKFLNILIITNDFCSENHFFNKLNKFYMNVDIVNDGLEALVLYKRNKYNIVISEDSLLYVDTNKLRGPLKTSFRTSSFLFS